MLDAFVAAVKEVFPGCLVQWEDFHKNIAFEVLQRYQQQVLSFNDDIQGTAAVALAGILTALRITGGKLAQQRIVYAGAGAAGVGIGSLTAKAMREESGDRGHVHAAQVFVDSEGLLHRGRRIADPQKVPFALDERAMAHYGFERRRRTTCWRSSAACGPRCSVGTTAQPGTFSEAVVRGNGPARRTPGDSALEQSHLAGRMHAGRGHPLDRGAGHRGQRHGLRAGRLRGKTHVIGQANNVFIFPGVGLGCILSAAGDVYRPAVPGGRPRLAGCVGQERLDTGAIYPSIADLRAVSARVAAAVIDEVRRQQGRGGPGAAQRAVREAMWYPAYVSYV